MTSHIVDHDGIRRNYTAEAGKAGKAGNEEHVEHWSQAVKIATKFNTMMRGDRFAVPWIPRYITGTLANGELSYQLLQNVSLLKKEVPEACDTKDVNVHNEATAVRVQMPWMLNQSDVTDAMFFAYYSEYESAENLTRYIYEFQNASNTNILLTLKRSITSQYRSPVKFSVYCYNDSSPLDFSTFPREDQTSKPSMAALNSSSIVETILSNGQTSYEPPPNTDNKYGEWASYASNLNPVSTGGYQELSGKNPVKIKPGVKFQILFDMNIQTNKDNVIQTYATTIEMVHWT
jgi:hypothetical protein